MKLNMIYLNLNLPYNIKIIIIIIKGKKLLLLFNNNKFFKFLIKNEKKIQFDKWSNSLIIKTNKQDKNKLVNLLTNFLKSLDVYFFNKIKFKGKGFRIKSFKKTKIIKFYFGKSHKTFILLKKIKKYRINKYKYIISSIKKKNLQPIKNILKKIKKYNIYTLRGLRMSKQIIYKRKGKKGTYI